VFWCATDLAGPLAEGISTWWGCLRFFPPLLPGAAEMAYLNIDPGPRHKGTAIG
jgi:hypothetical protein